MNALHSHIRRLAPEHTYYGRCDICGGLTDLKFRDNSTNFYLGQCCLDVTIAADRQLSNPEIGMRHPTREEAINTPNH